MAAQVIASAMLAPCAVSTPSHELQPLHHVQPGAGGLVWHSAAYHGWRRVICRVRAASSSRSDASRARLSGSGQAAARLPGRRPGGPPPAAESFALLAEKMADARSVSRASTADRPGLYAFEVDRAGRGPLLVIWDHRDPFDGEDEPPAEVTWPWPAAAATVTDVFGRTWTARCQDGQIRLPVSVTPLFVERLGSLIAPRTTRSSPTPRRYAHRPCRHLGKAR